MDERSEEEDFLFTNTTLCVLQWSVLQIPCKQRCSSPPQKMHWALHPPNLHEGNKLADKNTLSSFVSACYQVLFLACFPGEEGSNHAAQRRKLCRRRRKKRTLQAGNKNAGLVVWTSSLEFLPNLLPLCILIIWLLQEKSKECIHRFPNKGLRQLWRIRRADNVFCNLSIKTDQVKRCLMLVFISLLIIFLMDVVPGSLICGFCCAWLQPVSLLKAFPSPIKEKLCRRWMWMIR